MLVRITIRRVPARTDAGGRKMPHTFADNRMNFSKRECERDPLPLTRQTSLQAPDR